MGKGKMRDDSMGMRLFVMIAMQRELVHAFVRGRGGGGGYIGGSNKERGGSDGGVDQTVFVTPTVSC